ncbi:hypothetical protein QTO30_02060 [Yoonia sp. GPGPB17]|uniref:hypothetical protein n=1 Tax=Yoonia sp. GPGPB17 TaxID=3026147 RepID=UPI0030BB22B4
MTDSMILTVQNHLEHDPRLEGWSPLGIGMTFETDKWVELILSYSLTETVPDYLEQMFERAQGCAVYGCYHYPLFTLAVEELFRLKESALREAVRETRASKTVLKQSYADLLKWAYKENLIDQQRHDQWQAARELRNITSHKGDYLLLGPNDAIGHLQFTVEMTDEIFRACRTHSKSSS